jgi:hypothetical protein
MNTQTQSGSFAYWPALQGYELTHEPHEGIERGRVLFVAIHVLLTHLSLLRIQHTNLVPAESVSAANNQLEENVRVDCSDVLRSKALHLQQIFDKPPVLAFHYQSTP